MKFLLALLPRVVFTSFILCIGMLSGCATYLDQATKVSESGQALGKKIEKFYSDAITVDNSKCAYSQLQTAVEFHYAKKLDKSRRSPSIDGVKMREAYDRCQKEVEEEQKQLKIGAKFGVEFALAYKNLGVLAGKDIAAAGTQVGDAFITAATAIDKDAATDTAKGGVSGAASLIASLLQAKDVRRFANQVIVVNRGAQVTIKNSAKTVVRVVADSAEAKLSVTKSLFERSALDHSYLVDRLKQMDVPVKKELYSSEEMIAFQGLVPFEKAKDLTIDSIIEDACGIDSDFDSLNKEMENLARNQLKQPLVPNKEQTASTKDSPSKTETCLASYKPKKDK